MFWTQIGAGTRLGDACETDRLEASETFAHCRRGQAFMQTRAMTEPLHQEEATDFEEMQGYT